MVALHNNPRHSRESDYMGFLGEKKAMHSYTEIYTAVQGNTQLYRAIHSYTKLDTAIQRYTQLYRAIHSYTGLYKAIHGYTQL